jgi:hypothetical protein
LPEARDSSPEEPRNRSDGCCERQGREQRHHSRGPLRRAGCLTITGDHHRKDVAAHADIRLDFPQCA